MESYCEFETIAAILLVRETCLSASHSLTLTALGNFAVSSNVDSYVSTGDILCASFYHYHQI